MSINIRVNQPWIKTFACHLPTTISELNYIGFFSCDRINLCTI
jgi:hypothetical protein